MISAAAVRVASPIRVRSASDQAIPWAAAKSSRRTPAMFASDQTGTSLSPCSPMTKAWTLRASTRKCSLSRARKRAVSRIVPEPMIRDGGKRPSPSACAVRTSTGLVATTRTASGTTSASRGTMAPMTEALRPARSSRLSPGRWPEPAAMTTIDAPGAVLVRARADARRPRERDRVRDVHRLALGAVGGGVDEDDLGGQAGQQERVRERGADVAGADDDDLDGGCGRHARRVPGDPCRVGQRMVTSRTPRGRAGAARARGRSSSRSSRSSC